MNSSHYRKVYLVIYIVILLEALLFIFTSSFNRNPDEILHLTAAKYFVRYWLPARIDDYRIIDSYSKYGISYLINLDPVYFFAGKFAALIHYFTGYQNLFLLFRLFNLAFFTTVIALLFKRKQYYLLLVPLLSPQIWYVTSYFNNDSFSLNLALLIASNLLLTGKDFWKQSPLKKSSFRDLNAMLFVLLLYSKKNYYLVLLFFGLFLAYNLLNVISRKNYQMIGIQVLKFILVFVISFSAINLIDIYINGYRGFSLNDMRFSHYSGNLSSMVQEYAEKEFKPDHKSNRTSFSGINLRGHGYSLYDVLNQRYIAGNMGNWIELSFYSFSGMYGWMDSLSPFKYYSTVLVLYIFLSIFFGYQFYKEKMIISREKSGILFLSIVFSALAVFQSIYFSWTSDYQPQGRYLFPIFIFLSFALYHFKQYQKQLTLFALIFFLLSSYSFLFYAIPAGR